MKNLDPIQLAGRDWRVFLIFAVVLLTMPIWMAPLGGFTGLYKQIAVFAFRSQGVQNMLRSICGSIVHGNNLNVVELRFTNHRVNAFYRLANGIFFVVARNDD